MSHFRTVILTPEIHPDPPHLITQKLQAIRNKHFPVYSRYFRADMLMLGYGIYDSRKKRDGLPESGDHTVTKLN